MGRGYGIRCKECGNTYIILTGGGKRNFRNSQLLGNYKKSIKEKNIITDITKHLKIGFSIDTPVGYLPYYCENCKTLENKYFFQMIKSEKLYIPEYKCKLCNTKLKSIVIEQDTKSKSDWADNLINYKIGELKLYEKDGMIDIIDNNGNKHPLKCQNCNREDFIIYFYMYWD
jgi:hypothetical protein